jgi:inosine-uridine nucleoside N-ribohydrolase
MATLMQNWLGSYVADQQPDTTVKSVPVWDLVAGMIWHHPAIATAWDECHAGIVLGTDEVAGQIVTSDTGVHNVRICMRGNQNRLDSLLLITTKAGKQ